MAHDVTMSSPDVQPTGRRNARLRQTVGDMVRSLAVVLAAVAAVLLLTWRPAPDPVKVVDVAPMVGLAAVQAEFDVLAPVSLPDGWRPTSARWEPTTESDPEPVLHIGYVTPAEEYAQLSESMNVSEDFIDEQTRSGIPTGERVVAGTTWQQRQAGDRRSLVLLDGSTAVIVSGSADWVELAALAAALEPATSGV